jgi:hypothetical protein
MRDDRFEVSVSFDERRGYVAKSACRAPGRSRVLLRGGGPSLRSDCACGTTGTGHLLLLLHSHGATITANASNPTLHQAQAQQQHKERELTMT